VEVRDSKGKLIEHLALDAEEQLESIGETSAAYETRQVPDQRAPEIEVPASNESTPPRMHEGHGVDLVSQPFQYRETIKETEQTKPGVETIEDCTSSTSGLSDHPCTPHSDRPDVSPDAEETTRIHARVEDGLIPQQDWGTINEDMRSSGNVDQEVRGEPMEMSETVFKLLEDMEEHIQGCRRVPMTDKVLVGEEALLDYIDRIRSLLPEELRQARMMVKEREQLLDETRGEAERALAEANRRIEEMIKESEIVKRAELAAEEIVAQSRRVAHEIRNNATQYADNIMSGLEANLEQNLTVIRRGREELSQLKRDRQQAFNG
jgi:hypothetical protein